VALTTCHISATSSAMQHLAKGLSAMPYGSELCYLGAMIMAPTPGSKDKNLTTRGVNENF
jgi:hypothetical protein